MASVSNDCVNIGDVFYFCVGQDDNYNPIYQYYEIVGKANAGKTNKNKPNSDIFIRELTANRNMDKRIKIMRGRYKNDTILKVRLQISKTNEIYVKLNINGAEIYGYLYK